MKKTIVYFMAAFILLGLAGCGNANNVGDNIQNNETESYARVWDKNPNVQKVDYTLKSSDISKKETDMIEWAKIDIKAVLKIGEEQDYFTYAGESCTIDNARLSVAKGREADVGFAEVDIDNDGIKELAVEYIVTTGTASIQKMTDIYKKGSQEKMTTFVVDNHKISFTHEQEAVIVQTMKEWEAQGFMKENNITEFPFTESSISLFDSAVVEYEGEYFIKVTFATSEMSKENMNLKTIKVLLKCQNNQFDVVDMWY